MPATASSTTTADHGVGCACTHPERMAYEKDCPCPGLVSECGGCFYCGMRWATVLERVGNVMPGRQLRVSAHRDAGSWLSQPQRAGVAA